MKKWILIAVVALAVILLLMNLKATKQRKAVKAASNGGSNDSYATRPPSTVGSGGEPIGSSEYPVEVMPYAGAPTGEIVEMFNGTQGIIQEDMASGSVSVTPVVPIHTGISMPANFYAN